MKKTIFIITLAVMVLAGVSQVQAQTRQQQQELEQIARRSVNGLSAQDRQRVIQIMTDVYVAQGMNRQQAATMAEIAADNMFSDYTGGMGTPEQQRQLAEQQRNLDAVNQANQQPQRQPENWPTASDFQQYSFNIPRPSVNYEIIWWKDAQDNGDRLSIQFTKQGRRDFTQTEVRDICRIFETAFGATYPPRGLYSGQVWRDRLITDKIIQTFIQHPQRTGYNVMLEVEWSSNNMVTARIWIVQQL